MTKYESGLFDCIKAMTAYNYNLTASVAVTERVDMSVKW